MRTPHTLYVRETLLSFLIAACLTGSPGSVMAQTPSGPPPAPYSVTSSWTGGSVTLRWIGSETATGYYVYRGASSNGEQPTPVGTTSSSSYSDITAPSNSTVFYVIAAYNSGGLSRSVEVNARTVVTSNVHTATPLCATGSRLDDTHGGTANGNPVEIYHANNAYTQNWDFTYIPGTAANYRVQLHGTDACLDAISSTQGQHIEVWSCNGGVKQTWTAHSTPKGLTFTQGLNNMCLDVRSGASVDGTVVEDWPCNGATSQTWVVN